MFTGIVTDIGEITALTPTAQGQLHRMRIVTQFAHVDCRHGRVCGADRGGEEDEPVGSVSPRDSGPVVCLREHLRDPTGVLDGGRPGRIVMRSDDHRRVALQEVRFAIEEVSGGREFEHRLMDFNNLAETSIGDVRKVLAIARSRVAERLKPTKP